MSLILPIANGGRYVAAAGGTTTFAMEQSAASPAALENNPQATFAGACTAGNLLLAVVAHRNGTPSHTGFTCTDNNSKTWTKIAGYDNELADSNARCAASIWWREFDASGETNNPPTVEGDDGTSNTTKRCMIFEISADASYDWTVAGSSMNGSGTGTLHTGVSSGATGTISGSDLYVIGFLMGRMGTGVTAATFDESGDAAISVGTSLVIALQQEDTGQAGANFSTTGTLDGSDTEGIVGQVVFQNGA